MNPQEWKMIKKVLDLKHIKQPVRAYKIKGNVVELTLRDGTEVKHDLAPKKKTSTRKKSTTKSSKDGE